jgi:two-component system cell cycle sensor histidine kinase/response regulator CckA
MDRPSPLATLMVLDDEPIVRRVVGRILEPLGFQLLVASTAREALELLETHPGPVHLLMVDLLLSVRHGPALRQAFWEKKPGMRLLYLSGCSESDDANFLAKPFLPDALVGKVRRLLEHEATHGPAPLPS